MTEKMLIICIRKKDVPPLKTVPGAVAMQTCMECGELIYLAPSSRRLWEAGKADLMCKPCADRHDFDGFGLAPGAIEEFLAYKLEEARRNLERN